MLNDRCSKIKIAHIIDPIEKIDISKDTSFMFIESGNKKGWCQYIIEEQNLFVEDNTGFALAWKISINKNIQPWYSLDKKKKLKLEFFDIILMRINPPFNMNYVYMTYILELAEKRGSWIINKPKSLRSYNEKFSICLHPEIIPNTMISKDTRTIKKFLRQHQKVVVKPLDSMSGSSIFLIQDNDINANAILENLTKNEKQFIMIQKYQDEIQEGDKRIIIIDGKPMKYLACRIPNKLDWRGNVSKGATVKIKELNYLEKLISNELGVFLKSQGILFAGIDLIGNKVT